MRGAQAGRRAAEELPELRKSVEQLRLRRRRRRRAEAPERRREERRRELRRHRGGGLVGAQSVHARARELRGGAEEEAGRALRDRPRPRADGVEEGAAQLGERRDGEQRVGGAAARRAHLREGDAAGVLLLRAERPRAARVGVVLGDAQRIDQHRQHGLHLGAALERRPPERAEPAEPRRVR